MSMRWPTLSIRSTVLLGIGVAVLAPTVALWHVEERLTRLEHEPLIAQSRQAVLVMTAAALVEPLWTMDEKTTLASTQRALAEPSVLGLRLSETRPLSVPDRVDEGGSRGWARDSPESTDLARR